MDASGYPLDSAGRNILCSARLTPTVAALQQTDTDSHCLLTLAMRATESVGPPQLFQVGSARLPDSCFWEAIRARAIAQPALRLSRRDSSLWFRGRGLFAGQVADVAGMYAIATAAICYGVRQVGALWYIAANVMLIAVQAEWPGAQ